MSRLSLLLAAAALLTACPGPAPVPPGNTPGNPPGSPNDGGTTQPLPPVDAGQPDAGEPDAGRPPQQALARFGGPLELAPGVTAPADVRLGILWFPSLDTAQPRPFGGMETGPSLGATLPNRWSYDVVAEPPQGARGEFSSPMGGAGEVSWGAFVAFRDLDGDGSLSVAADGTFRDELLASSAGALPFDFDGPGVRTLVLWRKGTIGTDEFGVEAGFNLVRSSEPFVRPSIVPRSMDVPLTLNRDPRLGLMFCQPAYGTEPTEFACGQRVFRTPAITAMAMDFEQTVKLVNVQVHAGARAITDARVLLNGTLIAGDAEGSYSYVELTGSTLRRGANTLRVEAPQHEPVELTLTFPEAPVLQAPANNAQLRAGDTVRVQWSAVPGASNYDVSITPQMGGNGAYVTVHTNQADLTVPDEVGDAQLMVGAMSFTPVRRHSVIGTSSVSMPVRIVR